MAENGLREYTNFMLKELEGRQDWLTLRMQDLQQDYNIPFYIGRSILYCLRIFRCVRYEIVVEVKARFKPKKYIFTTKPENKVSDAKNKKQFDIPEAAEIYLREKLSDYIEEANIQKYYELGIVYERLLADSEKEPWIVPNLTAINKLILNKSAYVQQLIRLLESRGLLVKSNISNMYKVITCEEDLLEAQDTNFTDIIENPDKVQIDAEAYSPELWSRPLTRLTEVNQLKEITDKFISYNSEIEKLLQEYVKVCNQLALRDIVVEQQDKVFSALKDDYDKKLIALELAEKEKEKAEKNYKIEKIYNTQLREKVTEVNNDMMAQMVSTIENFAKLPPKEKLIMSTTNKLKNDLISIIFAGGKELSDFKIVIREGDLK